MPVTRREAQSIISEELHKLDPTLDDRTDFKTGPRVEARNHSWWTDVGDKEAVDTDRNRGLLRAYHRIGGVRLWAIGLSLKDRQRVYMERSAMRRLEAGGFIRWIETGSEPYFELTDAGKQFISD